MKTIRLDLQKGEGLTKAFTSRVADEGDTLRVTLTDSGSQLNMNNVSKVYLKATKPDGKYVYVGGTLTDTGADFSIPSGFNSVKGYFKTAYVEIETKDAKLRSTQPFMYYSYGDADLNDSNAGDYISRVEELIKELNDKVDAMIDNVEPQVNQIKADLAQARADLDAFIIQIDGEPWAHRVTMITGSVDWNTILNMGTYQVNAATGANVPVTVSGGIAGILTVYKRGNANKVQEFILVSADVKTNGMIYRRSSTGAGSLVWSAWTRDVTLYETENGMMIQRRTAVTTHDWNTLTSVGIYNVSNARGANKPSSIENYGVLEVFNRGTVAAQRYTTTEGSIFYRVQGGSPTAWYDWQQLANATWTNNNFVHKTGNENIAGQKTFTDNTTFNKTVNATNITSSGLGTFNAGVAITGDATLNGKSIAIIDRTLEVFSVTNANSSYLESGSINFRKSKDSNIVAFSGVYKLAKALPNGVNILDKGGVTAIPVAFRPFTNTHWLTNGNGSLYTIFIGNNNFGIYKDISGSIPAATWLTTSAGSYQANN